MSEKTEGKDTKKKNADWKPDEKLTMDFQETVEKKKKDTKE